MTDVTPPTSKLNPATREQVLLLETYLKALEAQVKSLQEDLEKLRNNDSRQDEAIDALERDLLVKFTQLQTTMEGLTKTLDKLGKRMGVIEEAIVPLKGDVAALKRHMTKASFIIIVLDALMKAIFSK